MVTVTLADEPAEYEEGLRRLLDSADEEFVPDLTAENRTGVTRSNDEEWFTSIDEYVQAALDRQLIAALDGDRVVGIMIFEAIDEMDDLEEYTPTNYVTELVVERDYRGQGIATKMYETILEELPADYQLASVSTKTWSTNDDHISILDSLGFECVKRIPDDRGEGIDTVYYARET